MVHIKVVIAATLYIALNNLTKKGEDTEFYIGISTLFYLWRCCMPYSVCNTVAKSENKENNANQLAKRNGIFDLTLMF